MSVSPPPEDETPSRPVVLFDGVCNLCNSAVQWLIERDPEGRLSFASLQSRAARGVLAAAQVDDASKLPDSIVLVDQAGVHVRSAAALRIAGLLGFPYSLARIALLVPRPVRDAVYELVARNRYRWFGRRDVCMRPTPELAARFLDAGEPPVSDSSEPETEPQEGALSLAATWLRAGLSRLAIVYFLVYMLPFPLTLLDYVPALPVLDKIPGLGAVMDWLPGLYGKMMDPLTTSVAKRVFGVEAATEPTGSGDRTFDYVLLAVTASLAVVIAAGWTLASKGRRISPRALDASRVVARYYLATNMLFYGWIKVFPLQFPALGPDRLIQPYGDSSPMGLAWTFLGASAAYQVFSGLAELLCGYLLFWRRTALLGAIVGIGVLANVAALNFFFDVPVKLFSSHLLLIALFIAAKDLPRLAALLGSNLPIAARVDRPFWKVTRRRTVAIGIAKLALIATLTIAYVTSSLERAHRTGYLREPSPVAGIYRVESFERAGLRDRENEDAERWVRVGINPPFTITVQRATGEAVRMLLALDEEAGTLSLYDRGAQAPAEPQFKFQKVEPGLLRLEGIFEGESTAVLMRRSDQGSLFMERGYHWINEYPFNR